VPKYVGFEISATRRDAYAVQRSETVVSLAFVARMSLDRDLDAHPTPALSDYVLTNTDPP
jgi:hypothetical protein